MQKNLLEYLEYTARRLPDKTAFIDSSGSITFAELRERARAIGAALSDSDPTRPIAVLAEQNIDSVAAMLGVLCAGCFYLPLDPKTPSARLESIIRRAEPQSVIHSAKTKRCADSLALDKYELTSLIERGKCTANADSLVDLRVRSTLDIDPCYLIFTSGSTGEPKGIAVSHRSVIDFIDWYTPTCELNECDILANQAPFFFDLSVKNLYSTLALGCTCALLEKKLFSFPILLIERLDSLGVTVLSWATSAFHLTANSGVLAERVPNALRRVILGGEALGAKQLNIWRRALPKVEYINLYGPTEVTVDCTYYKIDREFSDGEPIPIGRACENKDVILLDSDLKPVKRGESGEICVRGSGVALGYYNDPERTAQSFIQNPLNSRYPERLYRTGDIAFENDRGELVFLARIDSQIKHMGYRIELGEIETAIAGIAGIQENVCLFDRENDRIICIYRGELDDADLASRVTRLLPRYMLPSSFVRRVALPRNANGKLDRASLRDEYVPEVTR